jgi:hypothetical protein
LARWWTAPDADELSAVPRPGNTGAAVFRLRTADLARLAVASHLRPSDQENHESHPG